MFRYLVEHHGYRSIALESDCLAGLAVDAFVTRGVGSLEEVMRRGFSHGFGGLEANRELVGWMRAYNHDRPAAEQLRFFGFDGPMELASAPSPRQPLVTLRGYLADHLDAGLLPRGADAIEELIGADERWADPEAVLDPARSVGASADAKQLRVVADDLLTLLMAESPHLVAATSRDDWWRACLHGRTAAGLLRYHAVLADTSPDRISRAGAVRDTMMADNLSAIVDHQARQGSTLVFAQNGHLQKGEFHWQTVGWEPAQLFRWWSAGSIVHAHLGDRYAVITMALGAVPGHGIDAPPADTLEGLLSALPEDRYLIPTEPLAAALPDRGAALQQRTSDNVAYGPLDPGRLDETDALAFLKHVE
jgi:erythromycin esterase-like protein